MYCQCNKHVGEVITGVGRVLIKSIPAVTGICPIRSDPTSTVTGMTCALLFWHGWNSISVQCQTRPTGAYSHARIHTRGPWGRSSASRVSTVSNTREEPHGHCLQKIPLRPMRASTGIAYRKYPWDPWGIPRMLMSATFLNPTLPKRKLVIFLLQDQCRVHGQLGKRGVVFVSAFFRINP